MVRVRISLAAALLVLVAPATDGAEPDEPDEVVTAHFVRTYHYDVDPVPPRLICDAATGAGSNGACLPFASGAGIQVTDETGSRDVPFTVCIDNDGDGACRDASWQDPPCEDDVYTSYDHRGDVVFGTVGPLPGGFRPGCPGGAYRGYLVVVQGWGTAAGPDRAGTVTRVSGGDGFGRASTYADYHVQHPVVAESADGAGALCRFGSTGDPTSLVSYEPNDALAAVLTGGPWRFAGASSVTVTCTTQINAGQPGGTAQAAVSARTDGDVGMVAGMPPVHVRPPGYDTLYICSYVSWTAGGTAYHLAFTDFDRPVATTTGPGGLCQQVPRSRYQP